MSTLVRIFHSPPVKTARSIFFALLLAAMLSVQWYVPAVAGGTAVLPPVFYPPPADGVTCLPTCSEVDGRFLYVTKLVSGTFSGDKIVAWIAVPGDQTAFTLDIFDGDAGKNNNGVVAIAQGNWDSTAMETTYQLYTDPLKDGSGSVMVGVWGGNAAGMPNNAWYSITTQTGPDAMGPSRHYFYRLEVTQNQAGGGGNGFKLRSSGYLSMGKSNLTNSSIPFAGIVSTTSDRSILYPSYQSLRNPGPSTYDGEWVFSIYAPNHTNNLSIWDGDFDRGTSAVVDPDTDDPNTFLKPVWASTAAVDERAGGKGYPPDDNTGASNPLLVRSPSVIYNLTTPGDEPVTYTNDNPSGTDEWEQFTLTTDPILFPDSDVEVATIEPGFYTLQVVGLDLSNVAYFYSELEFCDAKAGCGPCVWPGCDATDSCPRTIGYWKTNVNKVYSKTRTNGIQESRDTLDWALRSIALKSPIFRAGLVSQLADPRQTFISPMDRVQPLSAQEADLILQKKTKAGNGMLGRALQQNLAAWLNLATGKISDTNEVVIVRDGVTIFEGPLMEALKQSELMMIMGMSPLDLQRAKDIADLINNGSFTDLGGGESNIDANGNPYCSAYADVFPAESQPPRYSDLPRAPVPEP